MRSRRSGTHGSRMLRRAATLAVCGAGAWILAGCATVGQPFAVENVQKVSIGETSRSDIVKWFGQPWRTGLEDGRETWTYGHYRYSLFGPERTRDLVVRFDDGGKVVSYTFSSTEPEDLGGVAKGRAKS